MPFVTPFVIQRRNFAHVPPFAADMDARRATMAQKGAGGNPGAETEKGGDPGSGAKSKTTGGKGGGGRSGGSNSGGGGNSESSSGGSKS